jgi:hypothetical protein
MPRRDASLVSVPRHIRLPLATAPIALHRCRMLLPLLPAGEYKSEAEFGHDMFNTAKSCSRWYSWHLWYKKFFQPAHGRLPPPYWEGGEIPGYDAKHDEHVTAFKAAKKLR